jgi:protoporphyrinogen oxidase
MGSVLRATSPFNVKKIAIIGAGPSGLAAAKFLLAEEYLEKIDLFEQQSEVGGVS